MFTDPRLVHAVADRRRDALLAAAAASARSDPHRSRTTPSPFRLRLLGMRLCDAVSRIVDDFEPWPDFRLPNTPRP